MIVFATLPFVIPELGPHGALPLGRYLCELDEIESRFVTHQDFAASSTRPGIWQDLLDVLAFLSVKRVRVAALWVAGGYTTTKIDPADIDVCVVVDAQRLASQGALPFVSQLVSGQKAAGLKVDAFVVPWWPVELPTRGLSADVDLYNWYRGYWDDHWQRDSPNRPPTTRDDALPRRGYLEVILDGYR